MSILPVSQNKRRALLRNLMIGVGVAMFALAFVTRTWDVPVQWPLMALLIAFCVLAIMQFETLDEMAKQAQYVAWYWGSLLGLGVIVAFQVLFALTGEPFASAQATLMQWFGDADPQMSFLAGMMLTPLLMVAGFAIWWSVYWLRRR